jgi:DNA invertase Pin-like site-specific DNA recombinase
MNSDVEFVAVDMPSANRLTIHLLAAVAEREREMRTKAALAAGKAGGTKLGNPRAAEATVIARVAKNIPARALKMLKLMTDWKGQGRGLCDITRELKRRNIHSAGKAVVGKHREESACNSLIEWRKRINEQPQKLRIARHLRPQYGLHLNLMRLS